MTHKASTSGTPTGSENSVVVGIESDYTISSTAGKTIVSYGILNNCALGYKATNSTNGSITGTFVEATPGNCSVAIGVQNEVTGKRATAFGYGNKVSGNFSYAYGFQNQVAGQGNFAVGYFNTTPTAETNKDIFVAGFYNNVTYACDDATAVGIWNTVAAERACAIGRQNSAGLDGTQTYCVAVGEANGVYASSACAIGMNLYVYIPDRMEVGIGHTGRKVGLSMQKLNGQIAMSVRDDANAPGDGGATEWQEPDGTLPRGMFSIQRNGTQFKLYYNDAGTVKSLTLGTVS